MCQKTESVQKALKNMAKLSERKKVNFKAGKKKNFLKGMENVLKDCLAKVYKSQ